MELTAFNARLGFTQGRLQSGDEFEFVLGDNLPGYEYNLEPGDHAEIVQETDLTDVTLVNTEGCLEVREDLPANLAWEVSIVVDGTKYSRTTISLESTKHLTDLAANVSKISGMHLVGVRLELVAV